jgi:hypothetical protein
MDTQPFNNAGVMAGATIIQDQDQHTGVAECCKCSELNPFYADKEPPAHALISVGCEPCSEGNPTLRMTEHRVISYAGHILSATRPEFVERDISNLRYVDLICECCGKERVIELEAGQIPTATPYLAWICTCAPVGAKALHRITGQRKRED